MDVRAEEPGDESKIRDIHLRAFPTAAEANLVDALRAAGVPLISLVAEEGAELVGHILFSPVGLDGGGSTAGLAPMAVVPERQRRGIGSRLVEAGLIACEKAGYGAVVVLGFPDYYSRFGFVPSVRFGINSEYEVPAEVFMVKELRKGALDGVSGTVKYHHLFNEV